MSPVEWIGRIGGCVVICAEGYFTERFLNICMCRKIFLWNVRHDGENRIYATVGISDFARLRPIARKTRTKVRIFKRCGLPFVLHKYRRRKLAIVGAVLFAVVVRYLSSHVTGIDIVGNERIETAVIAEALAETGVYKGTALRGIDYREVKNLMMNKLDDIAWIGINTKGSRVLVEIRERLDTKVEIGADIPCNLVASKDGIIRRLEVRDGQTVVKIGDMAEKGDLLVSGAVDSASSGIRYIHSFGEVYAETVYKETREYASEYTEKKPTGELTKRYSIEAAGKSLKLYLKDEPPYSEYDRRLEQTEYKTARLPLPSVIVKCETYSELRAEKRKRSTEEAVELGKKELDGELRKKIPETAEIKEKNITYRLTEDGGTAVTAEYICEENIAVRAVIERDTKGAEH